MAHFLQSADHAVFLLRRHACKDDLVFKRRLEVFIRELLQLKTGNYTRVFALDNANAFCDAFRSQAIVSCDHDDANVCAVAELHRIRHFGPRRICHNGQPEERHLLLNQLRRIGAKRRGQVHLSCEVAARNRDDAEAVSCVAVVLRHNFIALRLRQRHNFAVDGDRRAEFQHLFGCAFHVCHAARALDGCLQLVDGRHALPAAVKRKLAHARRAAHRILHIQSRFFRNHAKASLCRVAKHSIAIASRLRRHNARVTAKRSRGEEHP